MLSGFGGTTAWLVPDDPDGYRYVLEEVKRHWRPSSQLRWPDYVMLAGESQQLIYRGDAIAAFELFEAQHDRYMLSELIRGVGAGIAGYAAHRGRAAAAALCSRPKDANSSWRARAAVRASITSLRQQGGGKRLGIAGTLEAALALDRGKPQRALALLLSSADMLEAASVAMLAAAARRRAGQLLEGTAGAAQVAAGDAVMHSQNVEDLEAMTEASCPGCSTAQPASTGRRPRPAARSRALSP
jgi:hypothetical protein